MTPVKNTLNLREERKSSASKPKKNLQIPPEEMGYQGKFSKTSQQPYGTQAAPGGPNQA